MQKSTLPAVCLTAIGSATFLAVAFERSERSHLMGLDLIQLDLMERNHQMPGWGYRELLSIALALLAAAYFFLSRAMAGRSFNWHLPRLHWRRTSAIAQLDRLAAIRETAPAWRRLFTRLAWLELRYPLSLGHVLWIGGLMIPLCLLGITSGSFDSVGAAVLGILYILLSSPLLGVWTFQAEGGKRARFLADHGLSPQVVWLSKQLVWGMVTVAVTVPCVLLIGIANEQEVQVYRNTFSSMFHRDVPGASAVTFAFLLACQGYTAGQFASVLISRGVTAGFVGFVISTLLAPWTSLMIGLQVPLSISVAPPVTFMLAATCIWTRHWLLESATWRSWMRLGLLTSVTLILLWAGTGAYRVYEVPRPRFVEDLAAAREAHGILITLEEAETATLYRQALSSIKWSATAKENVPDPAQKSAVHGWKYATEFEQHMITQNQVPLRQILALTARRSCAFNDPLRPYSERTSSQGGASEAATLLLLSARELEAADKLDEALDRYIAVLRLGRHVAYRGDRGDWYFGTVMESKVNEWIPLWAAHSGQTPERIAAGIQRIGEETALFPSLRDAVLTEQCIARRAVRNDWSALLQKRQDKEDEAWLRMKFTALDRFCPWERARTMRVWDLVDVAQLHCLNVLDEALAAPGGLDMQQWAEMAGLEQNINFAAQVAYNRQQQTAVRYRSEDEDFFAPRQLSATRAQRVPWKWLKTTFPLNTTEGPYVLEAIWGTQLRRALTLRTMNLRLKLAAFKKTHWDYPEQLDDVAAGKDAIDPYTGAEFGYRPHGFPSPIVAENGTTLSRETFDARQPLLWSAGPYNARNVVPLTARKGLPGQIPVLGVSGSATLSALVFTLP